MSDRPSKDWEERFAQVPNAWLLACARLGLSGTEWSVLAYVVARTTGDWDARRGLFGRPWARISSREIGEHVGVDAANVRRALESLIERRCLRRVRPASGRRPAAIGPEPLLTAVSQGDTDCAEPPAANLADALAGLSPELRRHAEPFCGRAATSEAQPCHREHGYASQDERPSVAV
jgi:DNA-binding MarR family transcriptional regulator